MKMKTKTKGLTALLALMVFPFSARAAEEKTWGGESREKVLEEFSRIAESARKEWQVPGMAVSVVQGDRVIFARGYGVRRLGKEDPVTPETLFRSAPSRNPSPLPSWPWKWMPAA